MLLKSVTFIRNTPYYGAGVSAAFPDETADNYVRMGYAKHMADSRPPAPIAQPLVQPDKPDLHKDDKVKDATPTPTRRPVRRSPTEGMVRK